jgi:hypothetical protein
MADGRWQMANGKWQMANGNALTPHLHLPFSIFHFPSSPKPRTFHHAVV